MHWFLSSTVPRCTDEIALSWPLRFKHCIVDSFEQELRTDTLLQPIARVFVYRAGLKLYQGKHGKFYMISSVLEVVLTAFSTAN